MANAKPQDRLTFGDVAAFDADDSPGELDAGRWVPVTRSPWRHGVVVGNVVFALKLWARDTPGWQVATADPGVKLDHDPDVLRGPDVGVIRADRSPQGLGVDGWLTGAPDLVVEVAGDAQAPTKLTAKALEFLEAGAKAAIEALANLGWVHRDAGNLRQAGACLEDDQPGPKG